MSMEIIAKWVEFHNSASLMDFKDMSELMYMENVDGHTWNTRVCSILTLSFILFFWLGADKDTQAKQAIWVHSKKQLYLWICLVQAKAVGCWTFLSKQMRYPGELHISGDADFLIRKSPAEKDFE